MPAVNALQAEQRHGVQGSAHDAACIVAVRYRLDPSVRPHIRHVLPFGEQARYHAMGRYGRMFSGHVSSTLSGHEGTRPAQGHLHAYFLPTDADGDGFIDHLTVYARGGFEEAELQALQSLSFLSWHQAAIRFKFLGAYNRSQIRTVSNLGFSAAWRSFTPMVLFRHPKKYRR